MSVLLINDGNGECIVIVALPFNMNMTGSCQISQILIPGGVSSKKPSTMLKSLSTAYERFFLSKWRLDSVRGCELPHTVLGFIKNVGLESKGTAKVCYWYKI